MPQLLDYPTYAWQVWRGARSRGEAELDRNRRADVAGYIDVSRPLTILDLANGRLRPQYAILRAQGHRVVGIDLVNRPEHFVEGARLCRRARALRRTVAAPVSGNARRRAGVRRCRTTAVPGFNL